MGLGNIGNYMDENWHGGQIEADFFRHPEMTIEETLKVDKKPRTLVWNWRHAMTRELMRGRHKNEILYKYQEVIKRFNLLDKVSAFLDKNDGFLGWFIVDVSNFDDKFGYEDMPEDMRRCNLYAYNATELREIISRSLISENDGTMDGFLNSDEGIHEEVHYIDEYTGLPCVDDIQSIFDNDDDRLAGIADYFLGRNWMSVNERNSFVNSKNKLAYLVSVVKRAFTPKSKSDGKFEDVVNDFDVKQQELEAPAGAPVKYVEVTNIQENRMDDLGNGVVMPRNYDIKHEVMKSDLVKDVQVGRPVRQQEVTNLQERKVDDIGSTDLKKDIEVVNNSVRKLDDIGDTALRKEFTIKDEYKPSTKTDIIIDRLTKSVMVEQEKGSNRTDMELQKKVENTDADVTRESPMVEINTDVPDYGLFDDNMSELTKKDFKDDVKFDNVEEFTIDDIKDMKDDEFDYADLSSGDVDIDEMFDLDSDKDEAEVDDVPEEIEISNRYDWSW